MICKYNFTRNLDGMSHLITDHLSFKDLHSASYTKGFFKVGRFDIIKVKFCALLSHTLAAMVACVVDDQAR